MRIQLSIPVRTAILECAIEPNVEGNALLTVWKESDPGNKYQTVSPTPALADVEATLLSYFEARPGAVKALLGRGESLEVKGIE